MPKFNTERSRALRAMLGIGSMPSARGTVYLALHTSDPTVADNGATEASGGSYARQAITLGTEADGEVRNTNTITFTMPAGTFTHYSIRTASSGGVGICYDSLPIPAVLSSGETYQIGVGNLVVLEK